MINSNESVENMYQLQTDPLPNLYETVRVKGEDTVKISIVKVFMKKILANICSLLYNPAHWQT